MTEYTTKLRAFVAKEVAEGKSPRQIFATLPVAKTLVLKGPALALFRMHEATILSRRQLPDGTYLRWCHLSP